MCRTIHLVAHALELGESLQHVHQYPVHRIGGVELPGHRREGHAEWVEDEGP